MPGNISYIFCYIITLLAFKQCAMQCMLAVRFFAGRDRCFSLYVAIVSSSVRHGSLTILANSLCLISYPVAVLFSNRKSTEHPQSHFSLTPCHCMLHSRAVICRSLVPKLSFPPPEMGLPGPPSVTSQVIVKLTSLDKYNTIL